LEEAAKSRGQERQGEEIIQMAQSNTRYAAPSPSRPAEGWTLERLMPPSRLFGANGIRTGLDGRIYVAQVSGSQISAVDPDTGLVEAISAKGGDIVAPDDLVFDDAGNIFATEITENRVSMRRPNGQTKIIQGDMPCANPITMYQGRLFAGECRVGGRIMELDLHGGPPRIILENVPMPNAMEVGPDGMLYIPIMGTNEIWRVPLEGGAPQVVATGLGVPDAVKFASDGSIVSTQVASGQVLRVDPRSGAQTVLANIAPGLDNLTFVGERLFVSSISGQINEVLAGGKIRSVVPDGLNWPLGLAMGSDGVLFIADGPYSYFLRPGGERQLAGMLFTPGSPGYCRGAAVFGPGEVLVTTSNGQVARWNPAKQEHEILAQGFNRLYGVTLAPNGAVVFAEAGGGRVLSVKNGNVEELGTGLREPLGVAVTSNGTVLASEEGAGRVVKLSSGRAETLLDGLQKPQGILALGDVLYVVDAGSKELAAYNMTSKARSTVATGLPVGAPAGVTAKFLGPIGDMSGPMGPFSGITAGADGTLYISADAEGSVLALRPA
jgi:sugar lactone lactonase YvrE